MICRWMNDDTKICTSDAMNLEEITVVVALDGGMCKATTPGVKQSRASQWTARATRRLGASVDMVYCDYA